MMGIEYFFKKIDDHGGWPPNKRFCTSIHQVENTSMECYFSNEYLRDSMNTTFCNVDEYLEWKMSKECIKKIENRGYERAMSILSRDKNNEQ